MTNLTQYAGMSLWVYQKYGELQNAYDLYQIQKTQDSALNVATKLAEISAGIAVGYKRLAKS